MSPFYWGLLVGLSLGPFLAICALALYARITKGA